MTKRRDVFILGGATLLAGTASAQGSRIDFESGQVGALPAGVTTALTGSGGPVKWAILDDASAPAGPKVLAETSADRTDYRFPLAIFGAPVATDFEVAVKFKPVAGEVDRAAGIAVRLADKDNYYVVRANALEDNVRLYVVLDGDRKQFAGVNQKVSPQQWHSLRLRTVGDRFTVFFDGKQLFEATDGRLGGAGGVALWSKADSVTEFTDLTIDPMP